MMKEIIQYEAIDGTKFNQASDCEEYECLIVDLEIAMDMLPKPKLLVGNEFLQHTKGSVVLSRNEVIDIIAKAIGLNQDTVNGAKTAEHNQTIFGRHVDDSGNRAARSVWNRFMCMNPVTDREYSQPYYLMQTYK
jgi:hypothetical protein